MNILIKHPIKHPNPKARDVDNTDSSEHRSSQGAPDDEDTRYLASYIAEQYLVYESDLVGGLHAEKIYRIIKGFYATLP